MYIKKVFVIFSFFSFLGIIFYGLSKDNSSKIEIIDLENSKNEKIISDSIKPFCYEKNIGNNEDLISTSKIKIVIPNNRSWTKNLVSLKTNQNKFIFSTSKRRFKGFIYFSNSEKFLCKYEISIRVSGDQKDHIIYSKNNLFASLDVHMKTGNVDGIVKFKLFLPHTRNHDSEIISSLILTKLNFLSPRTRYVDVSINNKKIKMIMQEKAAKEFLEFNKLRESSIVGIHDEEMWKSRNLYNKDSLGLIFPKIINNKWSTKGEINRQISLQSINKFANIISESLTTDKHDIDSFSDELLSNNIKSSRERLTTFRTILIAMGSSHALYNHNRRFYYDPLFNNFDPIYYDGNSMIANDYLLENDKNFKLYEYKFLREIDSEDLNLAEKLINSLDKNDLKKDLEKLDVLLKKEEVNKIISNLVTNIKYMQNLINREEYKISWINNLYKKYNLKNKIGFISYISNQDFKICDSRAENCKNYKLSDDEFKNLFRGTLKINDLDYLFVGKFTKNNNRYKNNSIFSGNLKRHNEFLNLYYLGSPKITLQKEKKVIFINALGKFDKVIIANRELIDWKIILNSSEEGVDNKQESRFDNNLLTSTLTIIDSSFNNVSFLLNGGLFEDSLNIIRSNGHINNIYISNSYQDAIDFDFSNLLVDKIYVSKSGNDCLDLSSGEYFLKNVNLKKCNDKGISTGEKSKVFVENLFIKDPSIGIVSKDSSELIVKKGAIQNPRICSAAYRKKQEFKGAIISYPNDICEGKPELIQKNSIFIEQ